MAAMLKPRESEWRTIWATAKRAGTRGRVIVVGAIHFSLLPRVYPMPKRAACAAVV